MARIKQEDYVYAIARIRVRETKLLTLSRLERLLDISDLAEATKFLVEAGYSAGNSSGIEGMDDIEQLLTSELKSTYAFIEEIIPEQLVSDLFKKKYDYLNAKLILKAEFLKINVSDSLSDMGTIEPEKLLKIITDRKFDEVSEIFSKAVLDSCESFNKTGDPQTIDFILDNASYAEMISDAEESGDSDLISLVNLLIYTANIRIFIRSKFLNKSDDFIRRAWIKSGSFTEEILEKMVDSDFDKLFAVLKDTGYEKLSPKLKDAINHEDGITEVEKVLDDYISQYLRQSKYAIMGVEPVVGYLYFKETEIKNARMIITGVKNNVSRETIKERLRLGYA